MDHDLRPTPGPSPRSGPARLGPFTGTQLTILGVTTALVLGLPVGAVAGVQAAKVAATAITSGNGRQVAQVAGGRLQVRTQPIPRPPSTVTARVAPPTSYLTSGTTILNQDATCVPVYTAPADSAIVLRTIRVDTYDLTGSGLVAFSLAPGCAPRVAVVNPDGTGLDPIDFDPGLPLAARQVLYGVVVGPVSAEVNVTGYLVPASQVPRPTQVPGGLSRPGGLQP